VVLIGTGVVVHGAAVAAGMLRPVTDASEGLPTPTAPAPPYAHAIAEIDHYELDGIPLFHLPMPGATILSLSFRVGRADEPVPMTGMTHLAEHLILRSVTKSMDHINGSTEAFRVTFVTRGSPAEASKFLRDVTAAIEKPDLHWMRDEANVLRTEAAGRQGSMPLALRLLWLRTGFQGIGKLNLPELFLDHLDDLALRAWIRDNFTSGNAAIWIAGELPDDLYVTLPPGPRKPPPGIPTFRGFDTPTAVVEDAAGVGASFVIDRSVASATSIQSLARRLRRSLRVDRGLGYDVGTEYLPVDADQAMVSIWASCLPASVEEVEREFLAAVDGLAASGPDADELHDHYQSFLRDLSDPLAFPARLDQHVLDVHVGRDPTPDLSVVEQQARLRPDQVAQAFRKSLDTMLLLIPRGGYVPKRPLKPYPGPDLAPMGKGKTYVPESAKRKTPWSKFTAPKLIVADQGVAIDDARGKRLVGIRWSDCVVVVQEGWRRSLLSVDGSGFDVEAEDWKGGNDAVRAIDRLAPADLVVALRHGRT
jgi:hypothetical protein